MTAVDTGKPDIYDDGERPERCANCAHCSIMELHAFNGAELTEYECERRPEFVRRTQAEARCNYWEAR